MSHRCHWPGCPKEVDPKFWGCSPHWYRLPETLRNKVWAAYRQGQEISKTPSPEYIAVAREVQAWIAAQPAVKCGECGATMELRHTAKFGGRQFYGCTRWPRCDGIHGAHPDGRPLGIPANKEAKAARIAAHEAFDVLWKSGGLSRPGAYAWMQKAMGLDKKSAHIGNFTIDQCRQLMQLLAQRPTQNELFQEKPDA